jgi:hypothetical protein
MIDLKELREGNYVRCKIYNGNTDVIIPFTWQEIKYLHLFEPVQITEEILLKNCGFNTEYKKGWIGIDVKNEGGITTDFILATPFNMGEWQNFYAFVYNGSRFCRLDYIHELQNLFKDLEKQDLEIKFHED